MLAEFRCPTCDRIITLPTSIEESDDSVSFTESTIYCPVCLTHIAIVPDVDVIVSTVEDYTIVGSRMDEDGTCLFTFEYDGKVYTTTGETMEDATIEANKLVYALEVSL